MARRRAVTRIGDDRIAVRLDAHERRVLGSLIEELRQAIRDRDEAGGDAGTWPGPTGSPSDPIARLYPPAFPDDEEAESAWAELVRPGLDDARDRRLDRMAATLDNTELDEAAASAWLGTLNDLRLVIGSQLRVTEREPAADPDADPDADSDRTRQVVFDYLGWLVGSFVDALAEGLPGAGGGRT